MNPQDIEHLRAWFLKQKRALPWRTHISPYAVLVSEIMLQQTQVATVIPYFLNWMKTFPTFLSLAHAKEEEVMKCWEGLGYYSRARNLQKAALHIVTHYQGQMPEDEASLKQIPGVGPYTAGALLSFAFHKRAAAVDGNVMRVLSRYLGIEDDIGKPFVQNQFRKMMSESLPDYEPWVISEALIELGALVCKKKADCLNCPLKNSCQARQLGLTEHLPIKSKPPKTIRLFRSVPVLMHQNQLLIRKIPEGQIMAGLHEFPYFETDEEVLDIHWLQGKIEDTFQLKTQAIRKYPAVSHGFTRYRALLSPFLLSCDHSFPVAGYFWADKELACRLSFSSGHKRILEFVS